MSSGEAEGAACGMKRATSIGGSGSGSFISCISASRLTYTGPIGAVFAIQSARMRASRAAAGEAG